jgi:hypothetical protein
MSSLNNLYGAAATLPTGPENQIVPAGAATTLPTGDDNPLGSFDPSVPAAPGLMSVKALADELNNVKTGATAEIINLFSPYTMQTFSGLTYRKAFPFVSTAPSSLTAQVTTSTGYAKGLGYNGAWGSVAGNGTPGSTINVAFTTIAAPFDTKLPKVYAVVPCDSGGNITGDIKTISITSKGAVAVDLRNLSELTSFESTNSGLTNVDFDDNSALASIVMQNGSFKRLVVRNKPDLHTLNVYACRLLAELHLSNAPELANLNVSLCPALTSLDVSGLVALDDFTAYSTPLTSLRARGVTLTGISLSAEYTNLKNTQLGAAALNQFFRDLAPGAGLINIYNTPGAWTCDTSIATAKGYTVVQSNE